jgi:arginase
MTGGLTIIGAPSSAGAYAPGQDKAPAALRAAGLVDALRDGGIEIDDFGDVPGFRWQADRLNPKAMNAEHVLHVASAVRDAVRDAVQSGSRVLVLGGDCTVEMGTVAGFLAARRNLGLVYFDLDTDLNTPASTEDGALDWMVVAHVLGLPDTVPELRELAMLQPHQLMYFSTGNVQPFERGVINELHLAEVSIDDVQIDPAAAGQSVARNWASRFEALLVHVDVDVLDFIDMPLAENNRRNIGLRFDQMMAALEPLLAAPNWSALTICEINPDHGMADGSTLRQFVQALTAALTKALVRTDGSI